MYLSALSEKSPEKKGGDRKKALELTNRAKALALGYPTAYAGTPSGEVC